MYLERIMGLEFGDVQKEIEVHFFILILCACMLTAGVGIYVYEFIKYGRPKDEALEQ